jgi:hypothetical protein
MAVRFFLRRSLALATRDIRLPKEPGAMQIQRPLLSALALIALAVAPAYAQTKMPPDAKLPPGMTPAIMQMMTKPGPAHPAGLPVDVVPVAGCIPSMGYHYVNKKNWPMGPIYGSYNGKPVFTEVMPSKAQFEKGFDISNIKPLPGYSIKHIDIWYEPHGHPGMDIPHYDIHAWYISHDEHMTFCGNKSGKRPAFV